ncbi:hypothetical protein MCAP1_000961 [Malassezia caprae]|uniref:Uncharacterized protein n=1 Tax=Malassezia caprae TaxID=1381934 RepID=A0AAF0E520_9BASI|nr:hypothetical protein MCAP1_000961 [Malassezia caprae]
MDDAARGAHAVAAWCDAVGLGPDRRAATLWAQCIERMPLHLLRIVGGQLSPAERGRVAQVRERRRRFVERESPYELSAAVQRERIPGLWKELVADEEGEHDDEHEAEAAPPEAAPPEDGDLGLLAPTGAATQLHRVYLAAVDNAPVPVAPDTPAHLVAAFQQAITAQFVAGAVCMRL